MAFFYLLSNTTHSQMFGSVIKTKNKTIVIDGGTVGDSEQLERFLIDNCNSCVDAWFFTHPHHDHIGTFCELLRKNVELEIKKIYHCFPSIPNLKEHGTRIADEVLLWAYINERFSKDLQSKTVVLNKDDTFVFDDLKIKTLRVFNPEIISNYVNNSSAVFRIETPRNSVLILGDIGIEGGDELIKKSPLSDLNADYTQMAHHGQNGVSQEFYQYIKPRKCIWPTPEWLWNNDNGNGFNSGPWQTVQTREWMSQLGVNEHFIEKDGIQQIEI